MGLVKEYGDRAPGPCPALIEHEDGRAECGMVIRPKDYARGRGGAHDLRAAVKLLIGAGAGCDEIGDEDPATADAKLKEMQEAYLVKHGEEALRAAAAKWYAV